MDSGKDAVRVRAETNFKKEQQQRNGVKAWAEYEAQASALRERTERLRSLRLAKESAEQPVEKRKLPKKLNARQKPASQTAVG